MTDPIPMKNDKAIASTGILTCPNMIAIASGKGGVGKTWFSITLSQALAKRGKRVLLFDGDLGLANVDIQLGLTPERDLGGVVEGSLQLKNAVTPYKEGQFDILAGRSGSGNLAALSTQKLSDLRGDLIELAKTYDYVLVDLGAGVDRSVRQLAGPAAITYVITNDEPTSLTDSYAFIKLARAANPSADMRVVVNMATNASEGQKTYETMRKACETFLKYSPPLAGIVRRDTKVRDAIRAQTPLLTRSPSAEAAQDVDAIAARM
ncbi:MAG: MinD/ParA family protein [Alphaproteobacteria bacterium]|nr:MinD/ParA family protein [Alphaproteobacteria bacterium]MBV8547990.1 MinD/ParA family protein [Alphaproteobacteria bacterium]